MGIAARIMHIWVSETEISAEVVLSGGHIAARIMHIWVSETEISAEVVLSGGHFKNTS